LSFYNFFFFSISCLFSTFVRSACAGWPHQIPARTKKAWRHRTHAITPFFSVYSTSFQVDETIASERAPRPSPCLAVLTSRRVAFTHTPLAKGITGFRVSIHRETTGKGVGALVLAWCTIISSRTPSPIVVMFPSSGPRATVWTSRSFLFYFIFLTALRTLRPICTPTPYPAARGLTPTHPNS
jgi:hypothetical protein